MSFCFCQQFNNLLHCPGMHYSPKSSSSRDGRGNNNPKVANSAMKKMSATRCEYHRALKLTLCHLLYIRASFRYHGLPGDNSRDQTTLIDYHFVVGSDEYRRCPVNSPSQCNQSSP